MRWAASLSHLRWWWLLSVAGKKLYDYTRQILVLVAEAENGVTNVEQLASGQVYIGATPGIHCLFISAIAFLHWRIGKQDD